MILALIAAATAAAVPAPATVHRFSSVALAPAGDRIAAIESDVSLDTGAPDPHGSIVVRDAKGAVVRRLDPCPTCRYGAPAWSPDGRAIAVVATDRKAGTAALMTVRDDTVTTLATVKGVAQTPRWSPNGGTIALLAVDGATKATGAVEAGAAQVGVIGDTFDEQRIAMIPASGGALKFVSPADTFVYEYDWTPDGRGFVATAAKGDGDNNWWVAKLIAVETGGATRVIATPATQLNMPRVSPDGRSVIFIGGLMSDFGSIGGDLYSVPIAGGTPVNQTPGMKATIRSVAWKGRSPIVTRLVGDRAEMASVAFGTTTVFTPIWSGQATPDAADGEVSLSANGKVFAATIQDFAHPPEIMLGSPGTVRAVTTANAALKPNTVARSVTWTSEGRDVQGWLLAPVVTKPGKQPMPKHPMIVQVHGGPSAAVTPSYVWNGTTRQLLERGYYIFQPNPRGSYGQGAEFVRANVRDFGGGDLRDILAGIDAVEKIAPVDDKRLGIYGHSYGGFMTMWTVTHSDRFKAGVAGAGIANWISYYGQNGIDQWMIPFFGASAYDDPAIYTKLSPLTTIKTAKTPTLIYVGERDVECPPAQSVEFWHGLRAMNVPTDLVIYEGEGHSIRKPVNIHDRETRILDWFGKYL